MNKKWFWRGCPLSTAWFIIYKAEWVGDPSTIICITLVDCSRQRNKTRPCARSPAEICPPERLCRRGWRLSINTDRTRVKVKIQVSEKWQLEETMQELHIHCKKKKKKGTHVYWIKNVRFGKCSFEYCTDTHTLSVKTDNSRARKKWSQNIWIWLAIVYLINSWMGHEPKNSKHILNSFFSKIGSIIFT